MAPPTGYANPYGANPYGYGQAGFDPPGAGEWQPASPRPRGSVTAGEAAGASPWEATGNTYRSDPGNGTPADRAPSLRPSYDEPNYRYSGDFDDSPRYLKPIPMGDELRSRARSNRRIDGGETQTYYREPAQRPAPQYRDGYRDTAPYGDDKYASDDRLFSTPNRSAPADRTTDFSRPATVNPPANRDAIDFNETRHRGFDSRAVRDLDRERRVREQQSWPENDNTASRETRQRREAGVRPVHDDDRASATRYAAVPIDWSNNRDSRSERSNSWNRDDRTNDRRPASSSQLRSGWRPIR